MNLKSHTHKVEIYDDYSFNLKEQVVHIVYGETRKELKKKNKTPAELKNQIKIAVAQVIKEHDEGTMKEMRHKDMMGEVRVWADSQVSQMTAFKEPVTPPQSLPDPRKPPRPIRRWFGRRRNG